MRMAATQAVHQFVYALVAMLAFRHFHEEPQPVASVQLELFRAHLNQLDNLGRIDVRFGVEDDAAAARSGFDLADAEGGGFEFQFGDCDQVPGGLWQQPEAVDHFHLQIFQFLEVASAGNALVKHQSAVDVGKVVVRKQRRDLQIDLGAMIEGPVELRLLARLEGFHRPFQEIHVQGKADFMDASALIFTE